MSETVTYGRPASEQGGWAIAEGVVLVILGLIALSARYWVASALLTVALPLFLVIAGILEIIAAFGAQSAGRSAWDVVFGIVALLAGILLFARPALAGLTTVAIIAGYFFVAGVARIVLSLSTREPGSGWGWVLTVGIIDILLGIYTVTLPATAILVFAIVIGIEILVAGIAMIVVGASARSHHAAGPMPA
jgi:uncharacterized membrane protein HdeD (DUF308 family)